MTKFADYRTKKDAAMSALAKMIHSREVKKLTVLPNGDDTQELEIMRENCHAILEDIMKLQDDLPSALEDRDVMADMMEIIVGRKMPVELRDVIKNGPGS